MKRKVWAGLAGFAFRTVVILGLFYAIQASHRASLRERALQARTQPPVFLEAPETHP